MGAGTTWYPKDDDGRYMGAVTLRTALAQSRNIVAVKLAERIGLDRVIDLAHRMGVTAQLEPNLSLALGSSVVSPLDQASGYSTIANGGVHIDPSAIKLVKDSLGNVVLDDQYPQASEVVSAGTAYVVTTMLEDVINHGTGYPNAIIDRPAAGKTGTTSNFRDAWFVGFTPDLVTAVWLGNDDYTRMNESYGGNIPARIWARFMKAALVNVAKHDFPFPADQVTRVAGCSRGGYEYYVNGTQPVSGCGTSAGYQAAAAATDVPVDAVVPSKAPSAAPSAAALTPPPDSVGDGEHFVPLDPPSTAASAAPAASPKPGKP